jgi:hypothetical protein
MAISRTGLAIAAGAGIVLLLVSVGTLWWLSSQGPVLYRSEERDPLSHTPKSVIFNPLRDRSTERAALPFIRAMRDGHCAEVLAGWEKDYRRKYAKFICESEAQHPLLQWNLVDWEDRPPLVILHYRGTRRNAPGENSYYREHFWVTIEPHGAELRVTKYDAMY